MSRDVVFDETIPTSQPMILTSEPAIFGEIRVLPIPSVSASLPTPSEDSASVTTAAEVNDDDNEATEEE